MTVTANEYVDEALSYAGSKYRFGAETRPTDTAPVDVDCSELTQHVGDVLGVSPPIPDGSWNQATHCQKHGTLIPVKEALETRGALLFMFSSSPFTGSRPSSAHVAVSLGDGRTMEARSTSRGVGVFPGADSRGWTHAGLIPGVDYGPALAQWQRDVRDWVVARGISNGSNPLGPARRVDVWDAVRDLYGIVIGELGK